MSIGQILYILWRRSWVAALTFLPAMLVAGWILLYTPGRYDAVATASIDPGSIETVTGRSGGDFWVIAQGNLIELITSQRVALDVVRRLNLTASLQVQQQYRNSESFGRESIDDWYAASLAKSVKPSFVFATNVLSIKYSSGDPNQAALIANAFLAATIDATISMKAASAEQAAGWFDPQLDEMRKELETARAAVAKYEAQTNIVAPTASADAQATELMTITHNLSSAKAWLAEMQSRLASGDTELAANSSDPDLQELNTLRERLANLEASVASDKTSLGVHNPRVAAQETVIASIRKQIPGVTEKAKENVHTHLIGHIAQVQQQITSLEAAQAAAQKSLVTTQPQRDRLSELQRDVAFRGGRLSELEKVAAQAKLESKLTLGAVTVLDKALPPIAPAFPKPRQVILVAAGAGLVLGLILALMAEMADRRVRFPIDLEFATKAPMLGVIKRVPFAKPRRLSRVQIHPV